MQALLAEVMERQRQITAARERSRTLVKPSEVQAAREQVQDEVEAVTVICKRVKAKLDELDSINAQLLDDDQASQLVATNSCVTLTGPLPPMERACQCNQKLVATAVASATTDRAGS